MPTPQAIKEPRESSAKTSLADGEAEIQQQTDRQQGWGQPSTHSKAEKQLYTSRLLLTVWSMQILMSALKFPSPINRIHF